jgi:pilus assembly protein CpaC
MRTIFPRNKSHRLLVQIALTVAATIALSVAGPVVQAYLSASGILTEEPRSEELVPNGRQIIPITQAQSSNGVRHRIELETGKSMVLVTDFDVQRVAVGDPETAGIVLTDPRTIQVVALKPGGTNILLWDDKGTLQTALDLHVGLIQNQVQAKIREILGNDSITVEMAGAETIVLRGTVDSVQERERAEQLALAFLDQPQDLGREATADNVVNLIDVAGNHQVMIEVVMAEMSRNLGRRFAVNFQAMAQQGAAMYGFSNQLGAVSAATADLTGSYEGADLDVETFLRLARSKGLVKILAEPTLVARSGERANFLAGGEVPFTVPQGFGQVTIEWKPFGVGVDFVPTVLSEDRIHLQISPEVSEPDFGLGVEVDGHEVPGFRTRRASTGVELGNGQSFAIAGLLRDDAVTIVDKVPGFGDMPILGTLFRSQSFQQRETELVMIVTPHLVKPLEPGPHPLPTDHYTPPDDVDFFLLGREEGRNPHPHEAEQVASNPPRDGTNGQTNSN